MPSTRRPVGARPEALFQPPPERQPLAARMRPRDLEEFVGQAHLVGERGPLRRSVARGPPVLDPAVGTAGHRQDEPRAAPRERDRRPLRLAVGGHVRRRRGPGDDRRGAGPARAQRPAHGPLPRRDPPLQQGPAGRAPAPRRGRDDHAHRRDDREPVLRGQRRAPLADAGLAPRGADRRGGRDGRPAGARGRGARARRQPRSGRRRRPRRRRLRPPRLARRRRRPLGAERPRGRDRAGRGRGRPRRGRARVAAARGRRGSRAAADPRLRPGRRRPLRHRVGVHQEPPRQRPRRRAVLAGGDDRGRRGPQVHRPAADHQRVRGRRERRPARAPGRGRRGPGARLDRAARGAVRAGPGDDLHRDGPEVEPVGRRLLGGRRRRRGAAARCRCRSTCATPRTAG